MIVTLCASLLIAADYPNPHLLVEASTLRTMRDVIILDVRDAEKFAAGHIPGAIPIDASKWSKAFPENPSASDWSSRLGELGIGPKSHIVIYADTDIREAARVWWILRYWSIDHVQLLNGGWDAWVAAGGAVSKEPAKPTATSVELRPRKDRLATKGDLIAQLKGTPPQIIDARSVREYNGQMKMSKRGGAIPGACHLEWKEAIDPKTGKFKTPDELAKIIRDQGIDLNQPTVTYCQSGGRASVMAFTLELMGAKNVSNYFQSWSEWGNSEDTPIKLPDAKK